MGVWYIMSTPFSERFPHHIIDPKKRKEHEDEVKQLKDIKEMLENPIDINGNYKKAQSALALAARQDEFRDCDPNCCDLLTAKAKDAIEGINSLIDKLTQAYNPNPNGAKTKTDGGKKSRKSHNSKKSRKSKRSRTTYKRSRR